MKISSQSIIRAAESLSRSTSNQFWGLLALFSSCEESIISSLRTYRVYNKRVSSTLQNIFYFGQDTKKYKNNDSLDFRLSNYWQEELFELRWLIESPNILDLAIFYYNKKDFKEKKTSAELVDDFRNAIKLPSDTIEDLFSISGENDDIEWENKEYTNRELHHLMWQKFNLDINQFTLKFDARRGVSSVEANPGELTRGPFTQPLYASLTSPKVVLLASIDYNHFYQLQGNRVMIDPAEDPKNLIVYGAPGTGKSYWLEKRVGDRSLIRVTFNPETTYGQFVGSYKPVSGYDEKNSKPIIQYKLVPGPFIRCLVGAKKSKESKFLIIEELNRSNVSAVFGDVFQLLDRTGNGESRYGISLSPEIMDYLVEEGVIDSVEDKVRIPSNMFIWASMNSADQGVYPLDSAFKRRWSFHYIGLDENENNIEGKLVTINSELSINWFQLRRALNHRLSDLEIPEDRQIGPFFLSDSDLVHPSGFSGKLLIYLWDDVLRHHGRSRLFKFNTLSEGHLIIHQAASEDSFLEVFFTDIQL